jgi:antitoxin ParD1/3/4
MEVTLTPDLEAFIQEKVATGRYLDASEVVREALRIFELQMGAYDPPELEAALLEAADGPHEPLTRETLEKIRRMALAENEPAAPNIAPRQ